MRLLDKWFKRKASGEQTGGESFNNHGESPIEANRVQAPAIKQEAMSTEPSVYLIHTRVSYGEALLDTLQLLIYKGQPSLLWGVSWRGGPHADGAGAHESLPTDMLPSLTAQSLTDWMLRTLPEAVLKLADFTAYATDARVIDWCEQIREMYESKAQE